MKPRLRQHRRWTVLGIPVWKDGALVGYTRGDATYDLVWKDAARTLTIGPRRGGFPGTIRQRELVLVHGDTHGGMEPAPVTRWISHAGTAAAIRF
ncbi:DUF5110 domain-containing protein [Xanthomonas graminis]|uniref:DUF5110 domain-containing protein n=1 Tax=Xanthomonas graminis TaxID=3390026 RepID=UPI000A655713|nr:DUF5110 domain-containing protein [Xanthomonas translucens]